MPFGNRQVVGKMSNDTKKDDGSPKFGRLLIVLLAAVAFCGLLTWVMGSLFPDFGGWTPS